MPGWECKDIKYQTKDYTLKFGELFFLTNQRLSVITQKIIEQHGRVENIRIGYEGNGDYVAQYDEKKYLYQAFGSKYKDFFGFKTKAEAHEKQNIKEIKYDFQPFNNRDPVLLTLMDSSHWTLLFSS